VTAHLSASAPTIVLPTGHTRDLALFASAFAWGSTDLVWRAGIGHEKCGRQGVNRSDTGVSRGFTTQQDAFLVVETAAMNKSVLP